MFHKHSLQMLIFLCETSQTMSMWYMWEAPLRMYRSSLYCPYNLRLFIWLIVLNIAFLYRLR